MDTKNHWETIYNQKRPSEVSWYKPRLDTSLRLLADAGLQPSSRIIDVGGGASTLVDDLLKLKVSAITVLDVSGQALTASRARLGQQGDAVEWIEADVTCVKLPSEFYDLWHDRAVFHFLARPEDRCRYIKAMTEALKPTGQLIMATFSLQGPARCSGLDVVRYNPQTLQAELGNGFQFVEALGEEHRTPLDTVQRFIYCRFRKVTPRV